MDHAREVELIQSLDREVQQLLARSGELVNAGGERPVLTLVGRRLRSQLQDVAALTGALAALLDGEPTARPSPTAVAKRRAGSAVRAIGPSSSRTATDGPDQPAPVVIRLKPRMPRGAWRSRSGGQLKGIRDESTPLELAAPIPENPGVTAAAVQAREPVYLLRKGEPTQSAPPADRPSERRDALERLNDFFKRSSRTTAGEP